MNKPPPRPPRWDVEPCKNPHCIHFGKIHAGPFHTAKDGTEFDRPR